MGSGFIHILGSSLIAGIGGRALGKIIKRAKINHLFKTRKDLKLDDLSKLPDNISFFFGEKSRVNKINQSINKNKKYRFYRRKYKKNRLLHGAGNIIFNKHILASSVVDSFLFDQHLAQSYSQQLVFGAIPQISQNLKIGKKISGYIGKKIETAKRKKKIEIKHKWDEIKEGKKDKRAKTIDKALEHGTFYKNTPWFLYKYKFKHLLSRLGRGGISDTYKQITKIKRYIFKKIPQRKRINEHYFNQKSAFELTSNIKALNPKAAIDVFDPKKTIIDTSGFKKITTKHKNGTLTKYYGDGKAGKHTVLYRAVWESKSKNINTSGLEKVTKKVRREFKTIYSNKDGIVKAEYRKRGVKFKYKKEGINKSILKVTTKPYEKGFQTTFWGRGRDGEYTKKYVVINHKKGIQFINRDHDLYEHYLALNRGGKAGKKLPFKQRIYNRVIDVLPLTRSAKIGYFGKKSKDPYLNTAYRLDKFNNQKNRKPDDLRKRIRYESIPVLNEYSPLPKVILGKQHKPSKFSTLDHLHAGLLGIGNISPIRSKSNVISRLVKSSLLLYGYQTVDKYFNNIGGLSHRATFLNNKIADVTDSLVYKDFSNSAFFKLGTSVASFFGISKILKSGLSKKYKIPLILLLGSHLPNVLRDKFRYNKEDYEKDRLVRKGSYWELSSGYLYGGRVQYKIPSHRVTAKLDPAFHGLFTSTGNIEKLNRYSRPHSLTHDNFGLSFLPSFANVPLIGSLFKKARFSEVYKKDTQFLYDFYKQYGDFKSKGYLSGQNSPYNVNNELSFFTRGIYRNDDSRKANDALSKLFSTHGLRGYLYSEIYKYVKDKTSLNKDLYIPYLSSYSDINRLSNQLYKNRYGNFGILEIYRRFILDYDRQDKFINPFVNQLPFFYSPKLRYGDPYLKINDGDLRIGGVDYQKTHNIDYKLEKHTSHFGHSKRQLEKVLIGDLNNDTLSDRARRYTSLLLPDKYRKYSQTHKVESSLYKVENDIGYDIKLLDNINDSYKYLQKDISELNADLVVNNLKSGILVYSDKLGRKELINIQKDLDRYRKDSGTLNSINASKLADTYRYTHDLSRLYSLQNRHKLLENISTFDKSTLFYKNLLGAKEDRDLRQSYNVSVPDSWIDTIFPKDTFISKKLLNRGIYIDELKQTLNSPDLIGWLDFKDHYRSISDSIKNNTSVFKGIQESLLYGTTFGTISNILGGKVSKQFKLPRYELATYQGKRFENHKYLKGINKIGKHANINPFTVGLLAAYTSSTLSKDDKNIEYQTRYSTDLSNETDALDDKIYDYYKKMYNKTRNSTYKSRYESTTTHALSRASINTTQLVSALPAYLKKYGNYIVNETNYGNMVKIVNLLKGNSKRLVVKYFNTLLPSSHRFKTDYNIKIQSRQRVQIGNVFDKIESYKKDENADDNLVTAKTVYFSGYNQSAGYKYGIGFGNDHLDILQTILDDKYNASIMY